MSNNEKNKNHIIEITTELIKEFNGDTQKITSRLIAERAGIGLGSINYFFGNKDHLITDCIQRSISNMLAGFAPDITDFTMTDGLSDQDRLISWASQTFDFLFENQAICTAIPYIHKRDLPVQSAAANIRKQKNYLRLFLFPPCRPLSLPKTLRKKLWDMIYTPNLNGICLFLTQLQCFYTA